MAKEDLTPFPKGVSGNPNGRPKGTKNRSTIVRKWLEVIREEENPLTKEVENLSIEDKMTLMQIAKAIEQSDTGAYKQLMDSAYGLPKQETDITTKGESLKDNITPISFVKSKDSDKD